jgi:hypothetical protein
MLLLDILYVRGMPCLTHWRIWLCHMEVGRTLVVLSPRTYQSRAGWGTRRMTASGAAHRMMRAVGIDDSKMGLS